MGDRWERRNPLVDQAVDVDAAVVPAPPAAEPGPLPAGADDDHDPDVGDDPAVSPDGAGPDAHDPTDDEDLEEPDGRFARRKPRIDRALGADDS